MKEPKLLFAPLGRPDEAIREFAMPIVGWYGERSHACGTAVAIAPHLALTAKHVFQDFIDFFRVPPDPAAQPNLPFEMVLHQWMPNVVNLWRVVKVWFSDVTDIAVLLLNPASESAPHHKWRCPPLRLAPPVPGTSIVGFGFHSTSAEVSGDQIRFSVETATTTGEVIEVHDRARDRARLTFPCFQTNARFDGSMSGGPVFKYKDHGRGMELCGIICSSLPASSPEEEHVSYAASLWPIMSVMLDVPHEDKPPGSRYPLLELVRGNAVDAHRVTLDSMTGTISLSHG